MWARLIRGWCATSCSWRRRNLARNLVSFLPECFLMVFFSETCFQIREGVLKKKENPRRIAVTFFFEPSNSTHRDLVCSASRNLPHYRFLLKVNCMNSEVVTLYSRNTSRRLTFSVGRTKSPKPVRRKHSLLSSIRRWRWWNTFTATFSIQRNVHSTTRDQALCLLYRLSLPRLFSTDVIEGLKILISH